jgi:hypothetical protein
VVSVDGTGDKPLPMPSTARFQDTPEWSNDGTRLAITRGYGPWNEAMKLTVVPSDGSSTGIETAFGLTGCCDTVFEWSPDDTSILVLPEDRDGQFLRPLLWDPATGTTRPSPWIATSRPAWQRRAP